MVLEKIVDALSESVAAAAVVGLPIRHGQDTGTDLEGLPCCESETFILTAINLINKLILQ